MNARIEALQALGKFLKLFKELSEAQKALAEALADLADKKRLPVTLESEHAAVKAAKARVSAAWQKLEEFEHELDLATRQD